MSWSACTKAGLFVGAMLLLNGCSTMPAPLPMYSDTTHPLSDTAVVDCGLVETFWCAIGDVDGVSVKRGLGEYRKWVRVLPGRHTFGVTVWAPHKVGFADVEVVAQPSHIYEVRIRDVKFTVFSGVFHPVVVDLGAHSSYEIHEGGPDGRVIGVANFQ